MALAGFLRKSIDSEGCEGGEYPSGDFPGPDPTARLVILAVAEELTEQASGSG